MNHPQIISDIIGVPERATERNVGHYEDTTTTVAEESYAFCSAVLKKVINDERNRERKFPDMTDEQTYQDHSRLLVEIANRICLKPQHRKLIIDGRNKLLLRFLLFYFNNSPRIEEVFPGKGYKLDKSLLLIGDVGVGKTIMMQIFSEYLKRTENPNAFANVSVTQMVNYYTIHNNLDKYTFNEEDNPKSFEGNPVNLCLNDIGLSDGKKFYGTDTKVLTDEFLHARYEIWTLTGKRAHLTTNLTIDELKAAYTDEFGGRLVDRFKSYNVLYMTGESRR